MRSRNCRMDIRTNRGNNMTNSTIKETLSSWLTDHPAISIRMLEAESKMPLGTLYKYLKGAKLFPGKHRENLAKVLIRYGYHGEI